MAELGPHHQHGRLHPGLRAPQLHRPGLLHLLEQQTGPQLHDGQLATALSIAATSSTTG
ncbi:hypothetical protein ACRAWF_14660 [Streptomyces sp. L7]